MWYERLVQLKKESGKTIQEISDLSGVAVGTLNKLFAGQTTAPKVDTMTAVVHALGYTLDTLYETKKSPDATEITPEDQDEVDIMKFVGGLTVDQKELLISLLTTMIEQNQRKTSLSQEEAGGQGTK